jgi:hypothetical protein
VADVVNFRVGDKVVEVANPWREWTVMGFSDLAEDRIRCQSNFAGEPGSAWRSFDPDQLMFPQAPRDDVVALEEWLVS